MYKEYEENLEEMQHVFYVKKETSNACDNDSCRAEGHLLVYGQKDKTTHGV
jgi:hypothetical protein